MPTMEEEKQHLRAALRKQAAAFDAGYLAASDEAIGNRLLALDVWQAAQTVFLYVSVKSEPDTRSLIEKAWQSGKRVCVPRCGRGGQMQAVEIASFAELGPAPFGLWEPSAAAPALLKEQLDLVVAPCVAADTAGVRLGNGAGFYDRYLADIHCPVLCLCRGRLLQKELPRQPFDVPMTLVITEEGCYPAAGAPPVR